MDDLRWDEFGLAGHNYIRTPNINRVAREGIWFKNAFVTDPDFHRIARFYRQMAVPDALQKKVQNDKDVLRKILELQNNVLPETI